MFVFGVIVGVVIGAVGIGLLAHRRPEWFANVVSVANASIDQTKKL
jgi:hypothetical protein